MEKTSVRHARHCFFFHLETGNLLASAAKRCGMHGMRSCQRCTRPRRLAIRWESQPRQVPAPHAPAQRRHDHDHDHDHDKQSAKPSRSGRLDRQHAPHDPVDHEQRARAHAHLLAPVHAAPRVHRREPAHEARAAEVEHRRVADVAAPRASAHSD